MALRVLLADESSTIKKAIQMALSDFGVEVKSVPSGLDVLTVSRTFQPDLVFADVLLTKKNGYEVCQELKADPHLQNTPVVLMWSSFMQLDQTLYSKSKANDSLEKPFDSETLRGLVEKYAPKINSFPLKGLLNHPVLPDFVESDSFIRQKSENSKSNQPTKIDIPIFESIETIDSSADDEVDEFSEVELKPKNQQSQQRQEPDNWSASSAEQFVVETESFGDFEEVKVTLNNEQKSSPNFQKRIHEQIQNYIQDSPVAKSKAQAVTPKSFTSLDEQLMKEEVRMMAEKICWQILPEITERIVREELAKLLQGLDKI